jgi:hypothetical protein
LQSLCSVFRTWELIISDMSIQSNTFVSLYVIYIRKHTHMHFSQSIFHVKLIHWHLSDYLTNPQFVTEFSKPIEVAFWFNIWQIWKFLLTCPIVHWFCLDNFYFLMRKMHIVLILICIEDIVLSNYKFCTVCMMA